MVVPNLGTRILNHHLGAPGGQRPLDASRGGQDPEGSRADGQRRDVPGPWPQRVHPSDQRRRGSRNRQGLRT